MVTFSRRVSESRRVRESSRSLESGLWLKETMGLVSSSEEEESGETWVPRNGVPARIGDEGRQVLVTCLINPTLI